MVITKKWEQDPWKDFITNKIKKPLVDKVLFGELVKAVKLKLI